MNTHRYLDPLCQTKTISTTEHLQLIKAECERLLEIIECHRKFPTEEEFIYDSAEAGWRVTINMIKLAEYIGHEAIQEDICKQWPIELLTKEGYE